MEGEECEAEEQRSKRVEFVDRVFRFHERRGTPLKRLPMLGGRELDIYHLYHEVQKRGGSEKVTRVRMWGEVARTFNLPSTVTSASYAIRNHFIKLLEHFEASENGISVDYDISTHSSSPLPSLPIMPPLPKPVPLIRNTFPTIAPLTDTDVAMSRLTCSLLSGLPNEVDFAFNIILILSHSNSLSLQKIPSLLDIMLAHVGVFTDGDPGLELMYNETWSPLGKLDFFAYWEMTVPEWIFSTVLKVPTRGQICDCLSSAYIGHHRENSEEVEVEEEEKGGRVESYRVAEVATVLYNLSTTATVAEDLSKHYSVRRFLVLAMSCHSPSVRVPALDCLANLAPYLQLSYDDNEGVWSTDGTLFTSVYHSVLSSDRYDVKRGMEVFGKLSNNQCNVSLLLSSPSAVYARLYQSLLLPDPELIMIALDSLYCLTLTSTDIAHRIATIHGLIDVLVWLLSFRIEQLSPHSLDGIKLFFVGDSTSLANYLADLQTKSKNIATPTSLREGSKAAIASTKLGEPGLRSKPLIMTVGNSLHSILSSTTSSSPDSGSEQLAREWLKQSYEVDAMNHLVLLVDMYAQYILHCSSVGNKTFLNNTEFLSILKCVFPSSQTREVRTSAKKVIHFITGLRRIAKSSSNHTPSVPVSMTTNSTSTPVQSVRLSNKLPSSGVKNDFIHNKNDVTEVTHFTASQLPLSSSTRVSGSQGSTSVVNAPHDKSSFDGLTEGRKRTLVDDDRTSNCIPENKKMKWNSKEHDDDMVTNPTSRVINKLEDNNHSVRPICLWNNCMSMRYSWNDLFHHVISCHISHLPSKSQSVCQWAGCSSVPVRPIPSLIRHLQTHHCSSSPKPSPPSIAVTLSRLKHCPPFQNEVESPLTKAVRVTAGLVLRNLCRLVPATHCTIRKHEHQLREMAASTREAAHALTECLTVLHQPLLLHYNNISSPCVCVCVHRT